MRRCSACRRRPMSANARSSANSQIRMSIALPVLIHTEEVAGSSPVLRTSSKRDPLRWSPTHPLTAFRVIGGVMVAGQVPREDVLVDTDTRGRRPGLGRSAMPR